MSEQGMKKKEKRGIWKVKKKTTAKVFMPLLLLAALFCTLLGGFLISMPDMASVHAKEPDSLEGESETGGMSEMDGTDETVSGNTLPEPECICKDKCLQYGYNKDCVICKADYSLCEYVNPSVKITIAAPSGWHSSTTQVHISVEDVIKSGNFTVKSVQAKVSQNGSWIEITEDMYVEISENCSVYVRVTDQKDNVYEKSRYIRCFDFTAPTLNAAVSDGLLSVKAHDTDSGVKSIYVNGYEFMDVVSGVLNVRLQQFDAGYEYFTIYAMDNAGNMSEVYKTKNPYYQNPEDAGSNEKNPAGQLPVSAEAAKPASATAQVIEHTVTDSEGNTTSEMSFAEQKKAAMREAALEESGNEKKEESEKGREFYTIQTDTEKVFYLIIDKDGEEETVYFLTEISENDLLNVTTDNSETLPKNSAALESAIPVSEGALPNNAEEGIFENKEAEADADMDVEAENGEVIEDIEPEGESQAATYIILGIAAVGVIGGAYYFKVIRKKEEGFLDEDDEEDEEEEYLEDSDGEDDDTSDVEEDASSEDDFFNDKEDGEA